jgi:hypothetical protein
MAFAALLLLSACGGGGGGGGTGGGVGGPVLAEREAAAAPPGFVIRFVYFVPAGETLQPQYMSAIERAAVSVQAWLALRLEGRSIRLAGTMVEICRAPQAAAYYSTQSWSRVSQAVAGCIPEFRWNDPAHRWIVYAQVRHQCGDPEFLGGTLSGVSMMPVQDLQGLAGEPAIVDDCGVANAFSGTAGVNRWVGGLAHEMGHALGLEHPAGCAESAPDCDAGSLMWTGYTRYPDTWLRTADLSALALSPFLTSASK